MFNLFNKFKKSPSTIATFFRFAGVGLTISIIDIVVLYLFLKLEINIFIGRTISLSSSMLVGYFLNRYFTFHHIEIGRALWHSIIRHFSVHSIGGFLNMGVFFLTLALIENLNSIGLSNSFYPLLAVVAGGISGLSFNFFFSKKIVFDN